VESRGAALVDGHRLASSDGLRSPEPDFKASGLLMPFPPGSGTSLHPLNQADAALLQGRLAELGFYRFPADGLWGMASRNALSRHVTGFQRMTCGMARPNGL
jgi:hypothetical protein